MIIPCRLNPALSGRAAMIPPGTITATRKYASPTNKNALSARLAPGGRPSWPWWIVGTYEPHDRAAPRTKKSQAYLVMVGSTRACAAVLAALRAAGMITNGPPPGDFLSAYDVRAATAAALDATNATQGSRRHGRHRLPLRGGGDAGPVRAGGASTAQARGHIARGDGDQRVLSRQARDPRFRSA